MKNYKLWLQANQFNLVTFFPYTTVVSSRILEQSHNYITEEHEFVQKFADEIKDRAIAIGCSWDNKVAIELSRTKLNSDTFHVESNFFIGWYDGKISVGLGVWQPDFYTKQYNKSLIGLEDAKNECELNSLENQSLEQ